MTRSKGDIDQRLAAAQTPAQQFHTAKINAMYDMNELVWPNYFPQGDDMIMLMYEWYSESRYQPDETAEMHHIRQRHMFMLWHEIERRGLYRVTEGEDVPEIGTFTYPWENQIKGLPSLEEMRGMTVREQLEASFDARGTVMRGAWANEQGRQGKVGKGMIEDEEMLGIYRRERKE